jgi:hypothetical protein
MLDVRLALEQFVQSAIPLLELAHLDDVPPASRDVQD